MKTPLSVRSVLIWVAVFAILVVAMLAFARPENRLSVLEHLAARCTIVLGGAFVLSRTLPRMPNKVCRYVVLFAVGVLMIFIYDYVSVRLLGHYHMGWTGMFIIALLPATLGTFCVVDDYRTSIGEDGKRVRVSRR